MSPVAGGGTGAIDRLERLLLILPRAQHEDGATFDELERLLEVDRRTLEGDLRLLTQRAGYLRAGDPADLQISIEADRVRIFSPGAFHRPPRLGAREALALVLGLRTRALTRGLDDADALLARLEGALARKALDEIRPLPVEDASVRPADGLLRDRALDAIADRRPLELRYLKPGAHEPRIRRLHPLTMVYAEGHWYLMGEVPGADEGPAARATATRTAVAPRDAGAGHEPADAREAPAIRAFRLDRILELDIDPEAEPFPWPEGFDPYDHMEPSRVFAAPDPTPVRVDYSPRIARWIEERFEGETLDDGRYRVTHPVADPEWLVRHVLQYGGEAVAHSPGREWVIEALEAAGPGSPSTGNRPGGRGISPS